MAQRHLPRRRGHRHRQRGIRGPSLACRPWCSGAEKVALAAACGLVPLDTGPSTAAPPCMCNPAALSRALVAGRTARSAGSCGGCGRLAPRGMRVPSGPATVVRAALPAAVRSAEIASSSRGAPPYSAKTRAASPPVAARVASLAAVLCGSLPRGSLSLPCALLASRLALRLLVGAQLPVPVGRCFRRGAGQAAAA